MLDFVLACARKEPHYRIYFLAFAWYYAGKTLLRPDCDAPAGSATPEPFVSIPTFLNSSSPRNNYFYHLSSALWTLCKNPLLGSGCFVLDNARIQNVREREKWCFDPYLFEVLPSQPGHKDGNRTQHERNEHW